jgi:hypothetical protein
MEELSTQIVLDPHRNHLIQLKPLSKYFTTLPFFTRIYDEPSSSIASIVKYFLGTIFKKI